MRVTYVLLPTVAEQVAAGDEMIVDPVGVQIDGDVIVTRYFDPKAVIGLCTSVRVVDGRLLGDIELAVDAPDLQRYSIGGTVARTDHGWITRALRLVMVGGMSIEQAQPSQR